MPIYTSKHPRWWTDCGLCLLEAMQYIFSRRNGSSRIKIRSTEVPLRNPPWTSQSQRNHCKLNEAFICCLGYEMLFTWSEKKLSSPISDKNRVVFIWQTLIFLPTWRGIQHRISSLPIRRQRHIIVFEASRRSDINSCDKLSYFSPREVVYSIR